ncbi:phage integrase N-terminal SAM-like domain-containing protein [Xenophilus arseniciresistens]
MTFSTGRAAQRPQPALPRLPALQPTRLLDQVRERIRLLHYSLRTEDAYVYWVRTFMRFHGVRHPAQMGQPEVEGFLSWLASERGAVRSPLDAMPA